jgi:OOP family OmpA-OmpF porin
MRKFAIAAFAALGLAAVPAFAADTGFYVGASIGQSSFDVSKSDADDLMIEAFELAGDALGIGVGYDIESSDLDDSDTAYSLFVGYRFLPYLAVEGAWLDLGEAQYKSSGMVTVFDSVESMTADAATELNWSSSGPVLSALAIWPISDRWEVFGRLGAYFADTELKFSLAIPDPTEPFSEGFSDSDSTTEFIWGLGVDFIFLEKFAARLEYQMIPDVGDENVTGEADVDLITLGVLYKF